MQLNEQQSYYEARAGEYDQWWERLGRYDRGAEHTAQWREEAAAVERSLVEFGARGDVLELACGTGLWTRRLVETASALTCVDGSAAMLDRARARVGDRARFVQADLFEWEPDGDYDVVFFSFWLSHVPPPLFDRFWAVVRRALRPGGRFFLIDSRFDPESTARGNVLTDPEATTVRRTLDDGRSWDIVKVFYEPTALQRRLEGLDFAARVEPTARFFLTARGVAPPALGGRRAAP